MTARPLRVLLALAPVALLLAPPGAAGPASASCAAPPIVVPGQDVDRPVLVPGATLTVTGTRFLDGCDDIGSGCDDGEETFPPYEHVVLHLTTGGRTRDLGTASADADGDIAWEVTVPRDLPPGPAVLETDVGDRLDVRIR